MARRERIPWVAAAVCGALVCAVLAATAIPYYAAWRRGDDLDLPGVETFRRFPCANYDVPASYPGTIQAFAVIDGAALEAESGSSDAIRTLVDAVFDRELPMLRCDDPLRRRVADAELGFRGRAQPPIAERRFVDVANAVLTEAGAPSWAQASVEQVHFLRTTLRPDLPRFIGRVNSELQLSDLMSPVESAFVAVTLGKTMLQEPDEFQGGPQAYLQRAHQGEVNPPAAPGFVLRPGDDDVTLGFDDRDSLLSQSTERFLDHLGFPP